MFKPVKATALSGYRLELEYSDGVQGIVDLSKLAGKGVFAIWSLPGAFERVRIGPNGAITWSEEVELCPDALYLEIVGKSAQEVFPELSKAAMHA
jgi:hypothetical protein